MSPKPKDPRELLRVVKPPGYSFGDVLALTDATKSNLQHWVKNEVIKAGFDESEGKGHHRRFSATNVIETQLAFSIAKFGIPIETIKYALWAFREFRQGAIAIYGAFNESPLPTEPGLAGLFKDEEDRRHLAERFVRSKFLGHKTVTDEQIEKGRAWARGLSEVWHRLRTGSINHGVPDTFWAAHFCGLFISKEADSDDRDVPWVDFDPTPEQLHDLVGNSAIVISLSSVVWAVGQRCKWMPLEPW